MVNKYNRNILYILYSEGWGNRERFLLRDLDIAKKQGYNIFLYLNPNSFIAERIFNIYKADEIVFFPWERSSPNKFHFPWQQKISIKHFNIHFDIIHFYDESYLIPLAMELRKNSYTAQILTVSNPLFSAIQKIWFFPLVSRIDSLILTDKNLLLNVIGNIGLPPKKIEIFGMGVNLIPAEELRAIETPLDMYHDYFLTGVNFFPKQKNDNDFSAVVNALNVLNEIKPAGKLTKLVAFVPANMNIDKTKFSEDVIWIELQDKHLMMSQNPYLHKCHLWISYRQSDLIENLSLSALLLEIPILIVRSAATRDFLTENLGVGEHYCYGDSRELRTAWLKMILAHQSYVDNTRLYKYFIEKAHSYKLYKHTLLGLYSKSVQRRLRLSKKRRLKNHSFLWPNSLKFSNLPTEKSLHSFLKLCWGPVLTVCKKTCGLGKKISGSLLLWYKNKN